MGDSLAHQNAPLLQHAGRARRQVPEILCTHIRPVHPVAGCALLSARVDDHRHRLHSRHTGQPNGGHVYRRRHQHTGCLHEHCGGARGPGGHGRLEYNRLECLRPAHRPRLSLVRAINLCRRRLRADQLEWPYLRLASSLRLRGCHHSGDPLQEVESG